MKNLIKALQSSSGILNKKEQTSCLIARLISHEVGASNVLNTLADDLLDNKTNLSRKYSLLIDESSIRDHGCTFIVSDEDGNTHGRLMTELQMDVHPTETIYSWRSFRTTQESFEKPQLEEALVNFLKRNNLIFDLVYYEGPYERPLDVVSVMHKEVEAYANNLVSAVKKYLR